jgi:hypothetical protein
MAIGDMPVSAPFEAWRNATGSPLGSAAAMYGLGALATYAAWPYVTKPIMKGVRYLNDDGQENEEDANDLDEALQDNRLRASLLLPFLPAAAHLYGAADFRENGARPGWGLGSWNDKDPIKKTASAWGGLDDSGFNAIMNQPTIPLMHSINLIQQDQVLNDDQRGRVLNVFNSAPPPNPFGFLSPSNLATGAIRAGAGYLAGHLAGKAMGMLFGLPKPVTEKMSAGGGIGMALINMGVV